MVWYIIAGIAAALAIGIVIYTYIRDRRYLKLKTSQAMSPELWEEIETERSGSIKRREHWKETLDKAKSKGGKDAQY